MPKQLTTEQKGVLIDQLASQYTIQPIYAFECIGFAELMVNLSTSEIYKACEYLNKFDGSWDCFLQIRAKVSHVNSYSHKGIDTLAYRIICELFKKTTCTGARVEKVEKW